jgi:hypothetical protein
MLLATERSVPCASEVHVAPDTPSTISLDVDELLQHWQGHRRVTRRVIEAFPEKDLFTYAVGGMRPCAALALELIGMASGGIKGLATGTWPATEEMYSTPKPQTKAELLQRWDDVTAEIDRLWPTMAPRRLEQVDKACGLRLPAVARHRTAGVLRTRLTPFVTHPLRFDGGARYRPLGTRWEHSAQPWPT